MKSGLARKPSITGSLPMVTVPIDPQDEQGGPCWLPTTAVSTWNGQKVVRWQNLTMAHWQHVIFNDESRLQLNSVDCRLRVRRDCFHQGCQAYRVQAGGGSVDVWRAFHSGANSHPMLSHRYFTSELYRGIFVKHHSAIWQHFGNNYRYRDDNATAQEQNRVYACGAPVDIII